MRQILLTFVIFIFVFFSCKKETAVTTKSTNSGSGQTPSQPSNANVYSGMLSFSKSIAYAKIPYQYSTSINMVAYFASSPNSTADTTLFIKVDSVSANNYQVPFAPFYHEYAVTYNSNTNSPIIWNVTSHNGITPSFTYINPDIEPIYNGYTTLPDTIFLNKSLTVNITGIYNMDSLRVFVLLGQTLSVQLNAIVPINSHSVSIVFPQSQISTLTATQNGQIRISVESKTQIRKILGKDFGFDNWFNFSKSAVVIQ